MSFPDIVIFFCIVTALAIGFWLGWISGSDYGFAEREPRIMNILVEKHGSEYYIYDYETHKFLIKGTNCTEILKEVMSKSPKKIFIVTGKVDE
jgi:hypothetical protein